MNGTGGVCLEQASLNSQMLTFDCCSSTNRMIFLGETFSGFVTVHNDSQEVVKEVLLKVCKMKFHRPLIVNSELFRDIHNYGLFLFSLLLSSFPPSSLFFFSLPFSPLLSFLLIFLSPLPPLLSPLLLVFLSPPLGGAPHSLTTNLPAGTTSDPPAQPRRV